MVIKTLNIELKTNTFTRDVKKKLEILLTQRLIVNGVDYVAVDLSNITADDSIGKFKMIVSVSKKGFNFPTDNLFLRYLH